MGWFHTHKWLKIRRGMLSAEVPPPQRVRGPSSTPGHQPRVPVPGRQVPITSGCKNQWELKLRETKYIWSPRQFLFFLFFFFFNVYWLPLTHPHLGTWPATQACALTGKRTCDLPVHRLVLNPLSHTSEGQAVPLKGPVHILTRTHSL